MSTSLHATFQKYIEERYKGKVWRLERIHPPDFTGLRVIVEFRIPEEEADELEVYRRINRVINVIAEGDKNE